MKNVILCLVILFLILPGCSREHFDLLIQNGYIIDGTGKPAYQADIGITGDKIISIGNLKNAEAAEIIDASGLIVSPGFIDVHTHCETGLLASPSNKNYILQGVTTVIGGNCGGSPMDLDIYFQNTAKITPSTNIAVLIGHNSIRGKVMGYGNRKPSADELEQMKKYVEQAMKAGAMGLSTGLGYIPGMFAETEELIELNKVAGMYNGIYASHIRDQGHGMYESVNEAIRIGEEGGTGVLVSHLKLSIDKLWGETGKLNKIFEDATARGVELYSDQYPYIAGSTSLGSQFPPWSLAGGKLLENLKDPKKRAGIKKELFTSGRMKSYTNRDMLSAIQIAAYGPKKDYEGKTLKQILESRGKRPTRENGAELAIEIVENGDAMCVFFLMDEKDISVIMNFPYNMICSDGFVAAYNEGIPHPRLYGTYPRVLGKYVREEKVLSLESAIYKMTALPAKAFKIKNRGVIAEGNFADITVFNKETVIDKATYSNPHQYPEGIPHIIVNGVLTVKEGKPTGKFGGKAIYGPGKTETN